MNYTSNEYAQKAHEANMAGKVLHVEGGNILLLEPEPIEISLADAKAAKLAQIDAETSAAIMAGFDYEVDGEILHFAYDTNDQQNFADTANMVNFSLKGIPGVPESIPWNGWKIEKDETGVEVSRSLVRIDLDANTFLALYMQGAMMHKAGLMELGRQRKAQVDAATTIEELDVI